MLKFCRTFVFVLTALSALSGCSKKEETSRVEPVASSFGIWTQLGSWPNTSYYIMGVSSLSEGSTKLEGNGIDVTTTLNNSVISRGGYYYYYNTTEGRLGKYQLKDGAVSTVKQVPFTYFSSLAGHTWIDENTLVMIGLAASGKAINYAIINTTTLAITNGTVTGLPEIPTGYSAYRVGGDIQYKDGKLYFSTIMVNTTTYALYKKLYTMAVSYPAFAVTQLSTDDRTAGLGNTSGYFATSFVDEQGDMYFLTSWNGVLSDGSYSAKSIYRIKKGSDVLDTSYYVDGSVALGKEPAAGLFMNLGNGKAIIKYQVATGYSNTKFGYSILNLSTGKELRKLTEIPDGLGSERNVYVDNGKAYIAVLSGEGTDYIWIYDSATDKVSKGLQIQGGYTSFSRLDKLQ